MVEYMHAPTCLSVQFTWPDREFHSQDPHAESKGASTEVKKYSDTVAESQKKQTNPTIVFCNSDVLQRRFFSIICKADTQFRRETAVDRKITTPKVSHLIQLIIAFCSPDHYALLLATVSSWT